MKANVVTISWLTFNSTTLVFSPVLWLSSFLFYPDKFNDFANNYGGFLYLFPIFYVIILFLYFTNDAHLYHFCSFRYLKTIVLLNDNEYVYAQAFTLLEEVFEGKYYEKQRSHYAFKRKVDYGQIIISFSHPKQQERWQLVLEKDGFFMRTDERKKRIGYRIHSKDHDQKLYRYYYDTLYSFLEQKEKDEKAREEIARKTQWEMKKHRTEKAKQKEEEEHQECLNFLLKKIAEMKKHQLSQKEWCFNEEAYAIERIKRNLVVKKDKEVFIKCTWLEEKPIIYYLYEKKYPKHLSQLHEFYGKYVGKRKSVH